MTYFQMFSLTLCMLGNLSCICCCQRISFFKINLFVCSIALLPFDIIACITLAKAGLVIGQFPPSIRPSVCPSALLLGCLVCVSVTPKVFIPLYSYFAKWHIEDVHLLFCAHFINIFSSFRGVELFFHPKCFDGV